MKQLIPRHIGDETTFAATNQADGRPTTFVCRKIRRTCWVLTASTTGRVRFGDCNDMAEDICHALSTGVLPGKEGRP